MAAALTRDEIDFVVGGVTSGALPDYQVSALLMAIVLRGMTAEETAWLTEAMVALRARGSISRRSPASKVGKHSTGGVGDKTSIIVAPLVAACGVADAQELRPRPRTHGRHHRQARVDPWLHGRPAIARRSSPPFATIGCAFVGQTPDIAPADKKLYALRDVTGTVESLPLIASSIMSKKIGEGTDALVLDVKVGRGAFMKTEADARALAEAMVSIGSRVGLTTEAVLTGMDAPLGRAVGNALEIVECFETLKGNGPAALEALCVALAARLVRLGNAAPDLAAAEARVRSVLASGQALDTLRKVIERQGGDPAVVDDYTRLPRAASVEVITATRAGIVASVDAMAVGRASMALGAGRDRVDATIDPGAGIIVGAQPGDAVDGGSAALRTARRPWTLER